MIEEMCEIWLLKHIKSTRISLKDKRLNMTYKFFKHLNLIQLKIYVLQRIFHLVCNNLMKKICIYVIWTRNFRSGVRRATVAPQDQQLSNRQGESTSHCLWPFNQFNTLLRKFHVNYCFQSIYIDESIERRIHEMSEIRP